VLGAEQENPPKKRGREIRKWELGSLWENSPGGNPKTKVRVPDIDKKHLVFTLDTTMEKMGIQEDKLMY